MRPPFVHRPAEEPVRRVVCAGLVALVLAVGGGAAADPDTEAVGALVDDAQRVVCSGALVAADVVLTAAHCIDRDGVVRWPWGFFRGYDVTLGGEFVRVLDGSVHPHYDRFLHTADLALVRIAGGGPRPAGLPLAGEAPLAGTPVRAIGFGAGAVGPSPRDAQVTSFDAGWFRYEPGTCPGDSGGPVLFAPGDRPEESILAGVVSTGAAGCASGRAIAVAEHREWLDEAIVHLDPPECRTGDGVCGGDCRIGDGDCPCESGDAACRLCAGVDDDCSLQCDADGACVTSCVAPDPDCRTLEEGADCAEDVECASSLCVDGACREPCEEATGVGCPPWAGCVASAYDEPGACVPYPPATVLGGCSAAPPDPSGLFLSLLTAFSIAAAARRRPPNSAARKQGAMR